MNNFEGYKVTATDWRGVIARNQRNTRFVIFLFVFIYMSIGLLIDTYVNVSVIPGVQSYIPRETYEQYYTYSGSPNHYSYSYTPNTANAPSASWEQIQTVFLKLISFKTLPVATLIMTAIALFSLLIAHFFHKKLTMMGTNYREVSDSETGADKQLYNIVEEMKIAAGLKFMPKIYIIEADYMNAFASGLGESNALVAITRGLLEKLDRDELQAVMAHELSHIRHNDIRLTMTVAILSNLMLIAIDLVFRNIMYSRSQGKDNGLKIIIIIMRFALPVLTLLLMMYLSRTRELMADSGCVELMRSNKPLASALLKIDADHKANVSNYKQAYNNTPHEEVRQASYLYDPGEAGIATIFSLNNLFSTHPTLAKRLEALGVEKRKANGE